MNLALFSPAIFWALAAAQAENWPAWRGPAGSGISSETGLPVQWGADRGVLWKAPLPGPGNSTPIVWGERVFVTQAGSGGKERLLLAFNRRDGMLLWKRGVEYGDPEPSHEDNPYCSASPATDGERIIAIYGSAGVYAYDLDGKELWRRDLGKLHHIWGNAASPAISGELCFLNCGPGERTFLIALDKRTGKTAWQVDIPGGSEGGGDSKSWTGSWSTPLLRPEGRDELIISYPQHLRAFRPQTGEELWSCDGLGRLVYTSPVAGEGVIVGLSGFMGPGLAVRSGGKGEVSATHRLWRHDKAQQRIGSGVIWKGHFYTVNEPGVAECLELATGKTVWRERLGGTCWSSAVLAEENIYVPDQSGDCHIIRALPRFERIAKNSLGETIRASIAVSQGNLFIRTYKHLWCIGR